MSKTTRHGENIANEICTNDAFGHYDDLTYADVWSIVDQLHTHFMDTNRDPAVFERWMREIEKLDPEMEVF